MSFRHPAERASNFTSSPVCFLLCLLLVAAFIAVHAVGHSSSGQLLVGDLMTAPAPVQEARPRGGAGPPWASGAG